ncbi:MAG: DUF192 domain-containing protein [Candidatus Margulisbacteria bacterium]|nr:DUF192 domain-containing protein [Candidatus Margulisiibacteriota bacterium]
MGTLLFGPPAEVSTIEAKPADKIFIKAKIGQKEYRLEIANTMAKRAKGLSNRKTLPKNHGMLFVFKNPINGQFCMEDMNFPLDFVWLMNDQVIYLTENVAPLPPKTKATEGFSITQKHNKVIEFNAGQIEASKVKIGDKIIFSVD